MERQYKREGAFALANGQSWLAKAQGVVLPEGWTLLVLRDRADRHIGGIWIDAGDNHVTEALQWCDDQQDTKEYQNQRGT